MSVLEMSWILVALVLTAVACRSRWSALALSRLVHLAAIASVVTVSVPFVSFLDREEYVAFDVIYLSRSMSVDLLAAGGQLCGVWVALFFSVWLEKKGRRKEGAAT